MLFLNFDLKKFRPKRLMDASNLQVRQIKTQSQEKAKAGKEITWKGGQDIFLLSITLSVNL